MSHPLNLHECQLVIVLHLPGYLAIDMSVLEHSCVKLLCTFPLSSVSPFQTSKIVADIVFLATVDHYSPVTTEDNGDSILELSHSVSEQEHLHQTVALLPAMVAHTKISPDITTAEELGHAAHVIAERWYLAWLTDIIKIDATTKLDFCCCKHKHLDDLTLIKGCWPDVSVEKNFTSIV